MILKTVKLPSTYRHRHVAYGKILTFEEIRPARILCLQEAQKIFLEDRKLLTENKPLHRRSQLVKFSPITCKDGLL